MNPDIDQLVNNIRKNSVTSTVYHTITNISSNPLTYSSKDNYSNDSYSKDNLSKIPNYFLPCDIKKSIVIKKYLSVDNVVKSDNVVKLIYPVKKDEIILLSDKSSNPVLLDLLEENGYSVSDPIHTGFQAILCNLYYPLFYMDSDKINGFIYEIKTRILVSLDRIYSNRTRKSPSKKEAYEQFSKADTMYIKESVYTILCDYFNINIILLFKNTYYHIDEFVDNRLTIILDKQGHMYRIVYPIHNPVFYPNDIAQFKLLIKSTYSYNACQVPLQSIQKYNLGNIRELCEIFKIETTHIVNGNEKVLKKSIMYDRLKQIYNI